MKHKVNVLVWAFVAALSALALAIAGTLTRVHTPMLPAPLNLHWSVLIPLGVITELAMFSVRYRDDEQTFSFGELVVVFGVAFYAPIYLLIGQAVALLICYRIRGLVPIRAAFNVANTAVCNGIVFAVTKALAGPNPTTYSLRLWSAVLAGASVSSIVQSLSVATVRSISERRSLYRESIRAYIFSAVATFVSASMGVLAALLLNVLPGLVVLVLVPLVVLYAFSRNLVVEHTRRTYVELLYETAQAIHGNVDIEASIRQILDRSRSSFRAGYAAVLLRRPDTDTWFSVHVGETAGGRTVMNETPVWVPPRRDAVHLRNLDRSRLRFLTQFGCRDALVAALRDGDTLNGLVIVADHADSAVGFTHEDRKLFERLAAQIGIGVANSQMERTLGALTRLEEELRHQATHDTLTGLANRELLNQTLRSRIGADLAVLLIDLDDFKTINDSWGHDAGDAVLIGVAGRLRSAVRQDDLVVRLGGDEFAVVLGEASSLDRAQELANRIGTALIPPMSVDGREVSVRCSVGVSVGDEDSTVEELFRAADVAMYDAKHHGKGQHRVFESGMDAAAVERMQIVTNLRDAISNNALSLVYQPIVSLNGQKTEAVEALLRWNHPQLGALGPDRFIPLAEESGLIVQLGSWALEKACATVAPLVVDGRPVDLHVNVSPTQIAGSGYVEEVRSTLRRTDFSAGRLVLEITERTALTASETLQENVLALRELGVNLALDDFGTGYSSLAAAHSFPLDLIKIDKLFVKSLGGGQDASLVRAILAMAETLNLASVAEGIETQAQLEALIALGCPYGQGYLFAAPLAETELSSYFMRNAVRTR